MRPIVRGVDHDGVVTDAEIVDSLENRSDRRVVLDHAVGVFGPGRQSGRAAMDSAYMRAEVHPGRIEPAEEWRVGLRLTLHEIDGGSRCFVVDRFHPFLGERAGVLDGLLADLAPARMFGRIVAIRRLATQHAPWADRLPERGIVRIKAVLRIFFGVEVVEIAEEFVEAMDGRQIFIAVAEVVLAELAGGVTKRLQQLCDGRVSRLQTHGRAGNAHLRKAGA